jgi:hypothetical protein
MSTVTMENNGPIMQSNTRFCERWFIRFSVFGPEMFLPSTRRWNVRLTMALVALGSISTSLATADLIPVDISQFAIVRIQDRIASAPEGSVVLGGIPFEIPIGRNNEWGFGEPYDSSYDGVQSIAVPVGIYGVTTVYTLANTFWGFDGDKMKFEFIGAQGAYFSRELIGNIDIRDWNGYPAFTTIINSPNSTNVFTLTNGRDGNPDYIDMQRFDLPFAFSNQELQTILITDTRIGGRHSGILSGITVASIPEPSATMLAVIGVLGLLTWRLRLSWLSGQ